MLQELSSYHSVEILFGITIIAAIYWFYKSSRSLLFLLIIIGWSIVQTILGFELFYLDTEVFPPRMVLGILPPIFFIGLLFLVPAGRKFVMSLDLVTLTYFHTIRVFVEVVLFLLYLEGFISVFQTVYGYNFDIFSGLTAPIVAYLVFSKEVGGKALLLVWNVFALILLFTIVIVSGLALPSPYQILSFGQPNVAVLYFPFNLLPTVVVPLIFLAHFASIYQIWHRENIYTDHLTDLPKGPMA